MSTHLQIEDVFIALGSQPIVADSDRNVIRGAHIDGLGLGVRQERWARRRRLRRALTSEYARRLRMVVHAWRWSKGKPGARALFSMRAETLEEMGGNSADDFRALGSQPGASFVYPKERE
jgi:hypothetical protein